MRALLTSIALPQERKAALAAFLETATVLHPAAEKGELDEEEQLELAKILLLLLDFSISVTEVSTTRVLFPCLRACSPFACPADLIVSPRL